MFHKEEKQCGWNFAFYLKFRDETEKGDGNGGEAGVHTYELYAPTRADRAQWIRVFKTISEMNKEGVNLVSMSPLEYLKEK